MTCADSNSTDCAPHWGRSLWSMTALFTSVIERNTVTRADDRLQRLNYT